MEKTLEELKAEAEVLGIEYNKNIGAGKLAEKIEAYYESQAAGDSVKVQAEPEPEVPTPSKGGKVDPMKQLIANMRKQAMTTKVVTVTNNDPAENSNLTADYFGFENQFFGKSMIVPFGTPVELPQGIIEVIKSTPLIIHVDEYVDGKRTGNKVPKQVKKYNISYEEVK